MKISVKFILKTSKTLLVLLPFLTIPCVSNLAHAEDGGVSESPQNSFAPDRVIPVLISNDSRQMKLVKKILWDPAGAKVITRYFGASSESTLHLEGKLKKEAPEQWRLLLNEKTIPIQEDGQFVVDAPFIETMKALELVAVAPSGVAEYHFYKIKLVLPKPEIPEDDEEDLAEEGMPAISTPGGLSTAPSPSLKELSPGQVAIPSVPEEGEAGPIDQAVNPEGSPKKERTQKLLGIDFNKKLPQRLFVSPGLGVSSIHFTQTDKADYSSMVATVKVSANYFLFPPKWDLGFSGFMNLATLSKSGADEVRFLGLNLRMGYIFPQVKAPWRLSLYGGWYYTSASSSSETFGYRNVSGPQLYPSIRRTLSNGHAVSTYLKFSPIFNSLGLLGLSNSEIATGFGYLIPSENHTYSINLDFARLHLTNEDVETNSTSVSLGGSMTF